MAEVVVVHGYCIGEATGRALRIADTSEDAEPGDTVVAPVLSEPVALADQKTWPMLRAISAHGHIQAQPVRTLPDDATGYYALGSLSTNDPDLEPYAGRKITLPDGTSKVIQLPYNAVPTSVDDRMAAQVNAGRTTPLVTVGQQVRAIWLPDAAEYVAPEPDTAAYYTAAQVDDLLSGLLDNAVTEADLVQFRADLVNGAPALLDTFGELAAKLADDENVVTALTTTVAGKVAKSTFTTKGDLLATTGNAAPDRLPVGSDGRVLTADSTVPFGVSWQNPTSGGGGGSGQPDLPEASRLPYTAPISPPADLLSKTTRYATTSAVTQPLPLAQPGRIMTLGWDSGTAALTFTAAARTDTATVTASSSNVSDTAITSADQGRLVTGTGIPAGTYVGTVTAGTSFLLSSSPVTQTNVNATSSSTSVTITDTIGSGTATSLVLPLVGEVLTLHCTHTGAWRSYSGVKPQAALDARYIAYETGVTTAFRAANTTGQAIPSGTNTVVLFPTVQSTSPLVTTSTQGAGTLFTVSRAGTWAITATVRLPASSTGSALVSLLQLVSGTSTELTAITGVFGGGSFGRSISVVDYFAAGTGFYANLFQDSGASLTTEPLSGTRVNFRLAWLHP